MKKKAPVAKKKMAKAAVKPKAKAPTTVLTVPEPTAPFVLQRCRRCGAESATEYCPSCAGGSQ